MKCNVSAGRLEQLILNWVTRKTIFDFKQSLFCEQMRCSFFAHFLWDAAGYLFEIFLREKNVANTKEVQNHRDFLK